MKNWNGLDNLKNIKNETLIIWGDKDKSYSFDQVDILNKNIQNSELKIFKGCSHNIHLEKPDEFNVSLKNFLRKIKFITQSNQALIFSLLQHRKSNRYWQIHLYLDR